MTDVVVYGATAAGVMAAAAAASRGVAVKLVAPEDHVGGMVSGGLSWTDVGNTDVIRGLAREFYGDVARYYDASLWDVRGPEPHVAERLLNDRLEAVDVHLGETLVGAAKADARITKLETSEREHEGAVFVDASYEGDLMAAADVPHAVGRESRELYGETWAGRQPATRPGKHNFPVLISPFGEGGSLLPHIREPELDDRGWPSERLGEADGALQAYGFRICLERGGISFRAAAHLRAGRVRAPAPLSARRARSRVRSTRPRPGPAAAWEVRRQLDRSVLAQRPRRLEP